MNRSTPSSRVVGAAKVISGLTFASRVLGLVRDATCAFFLGAGGVSAAFWVAFQIPNLFRRLFGEGALSAAFIPVFSDFYHAGDRKGAERVASCVLAVLLIILGGLTLLGEATLAGLWFANDHEDRTRLTLMLAAIMLPFMMMICVTAMLGGLLNVLGHFSTPACTPIVMNICMIGAAIAGGVFAKLPPQQLVFVVAGAVLLAGLLQILLHIAAVHRHELRLRPVIDIRHEGLRRIAHTMGPMVLGLGAVQINTLADTLIAYGLIEYEGAPTVLYYAHRLYDFPLGVFSIALVTAVFAELSRLATHKDMPGFGATMQKGLQLVVFVGIPASAGLMLVREPLAAFLFARGEFDAHAAHRVSETLFFYAAGVWAYGCQHVFIRSFYALKDSRTPLRIAVYMIGLNIPLNLILVLPLAERGLALSTAVCAVIQVIWLGRILVRRVGHVDWPKIWHSFNRTAIATMVMTIAVASLDAVVLVEAYSGLRLAGLVIVGVVSFGVTARLLRHEELFDVLRRK